MKNLAGNNKADEIILEELEEQLISLGYNKQYYCFLEKELTSISVGEISKLCNKGKLRVERYVQQ